MNGFMVEIGLTGTPFRAATMAAGAAMAAEADGAHAIWYPDAPDPALDPRREPAEVVAGVGLDPTDTADPLITAAVALLVARRVRVGIVGWDPGMDAVRAARSVATLSDLAPGRVILACAGTEPALTAFAAALRPDLDVELALYGPAPGLAAHLGWGWVGVGQSAESIATQAGDAGVVGESGIHLPVFVHEDGDVASRGASGPLLGRPEISGDGILVGTGADLEAAIAEYVSVGVTRIVIDNVLPYALPEELESSQSVIRSAIRTARLRHREQL